MSHHHIAPIIYIKVMVALICGQMLAVARQTKNDGDIFEAVINEPTTLTCDFGTGDLENTWMRWWFTKESRIVADNENILLDGYSISSSGTVGTLSIDRATESVAGMYRCYIIYSYYDVTGEVTLKLQYPPTSISLNGTSTDGYIEVQHDMPTAIACMAVRSKPTSSFRFQLDMVTSGNFSISNSNCNAYDVCDSISTINITASFEDLNKELTCIVNHPALDSPMKTTSTIEVVGYLVNVTEANIQMIMSDEQETVNIRDGVVSVLENETVLFRCLAAATRPKVNLRLKLNGEDVGTIKNTTIVKGDDDLLTTDTEFFYTPVKEHNLGEMCCRARQQYRRRQVNNSVEEEICKTLHVEAYLVPLKKTNVWFYTDNEHDINMTQEIPILLHDDSVTLKCSANATRPMANLHFKIKNKELIENMNTSVRVENGLFTTYAMVTLTPEKWYHLRKICCLARQNGSIEVSICRKIIVDGSEITQEIDTKEHSETYRLDEEQTSWVKSNLTIVLTSPIILLLVLLIFIIITNYKRNRTRKTHMKKITYMAYIPDGGDQLDEYAELNTKIPKFEPIYDYIH